MNPRTIHPSKLSAFMLLGFGLAAVVMAYFFAQEGALALYLLVAFLGIVGAGMCAAGVQLLIPGRISLSIDDKGITSKHGARIETYAWSEIESICVAPEGRSWAVGLRFKPGHPRRTSVHATADVTLGTVWEYTPSELKTMFEERHRRVQ